MKKNKTTEGEEANVRLTIAQTNRIIRGFESFEVTFLNARRKTDNDSLADDWLCNLSSSIPDMSSPLPISFLCFGLSNTLRYR